ncbi:ultraviolet-B receptor UVR8-like isoform X3 [Carica papaya]|uniref:ultraviolet-B receptor UVR8-like isoform X3 n=1 Tax=Carica papaya TaxID=3649 RepID=UPI000B8CE92F|nr:ultraviolet-B receptor UVR8-like isoform X3 [Carica papaya]
MSENEVRMEEYKEPMLYMCGYLPGASLEKSPILSPVLVRLPETVRGGDSWKDVCGGGCGFAMALSDEEGQSYCASGMHGETPEMFPLPTEASVVKAAAGWAHCAAVTETGEVYTWGWKECVPSGKLSRDLVIGSFQKDTSGKQSGLTEQVSPRSQGSNVNIEITSQPEDRKVGEEVVKRRRTSVVKEESGSPTSGDEYFAMSPCIANMGPGVRITAVAVGGRHTLALSVADIGQVWGWGYGGEGQLGLGSRIKMVSSPHLIRCIEEHASATDRSLVMHQGSTKVSDQVSKVPGSYVKAISCGGRHSAVITDGGKLLTFGWGLYGQCGHGNTNDQLRPTVVSSLLGTQVQSVAAGLWHTVCISTEGRVYAFGGNQFGQLGTGTDHAETSPKLLDAPSLDNKHAIVVSCGARHTIILTEDGQVYSWGWNKYGQLGLGDSTDRNTPSLIQINGCRPKNIACGWWHTLLLAQIPH